MKSDFRRVWTIGFLLIFVFTAAFTFGQGIVTGSIVGTVVDPQGAVVANANVTAVQTETNSQFKTTTNETGAYSLRGLPIGNYTVMVEAPNFQKLQVKNVMVTTNQQTNLGGQKLSVGSEGTEVTVEATAPIIESTSSQITNTFETKEVTQLPIGNGFDVLALMVPGAASAGDAGFSNSNGADISVNGQRGRSNNFTIDGQDNNDNSVAGPSLFLGNADVVGEFQIVTNNFSAEYGRNSGSQINYVTKSGTNNWHGTLSEAYRGNFTDSLANEEKSPVFGFCPQGTAEHSDTLWAPFDPTDPTSGCSLPHQAHLVNNIFGGTVGGPVFKDRSWFFVAYQENRFFQGGSPSQTSQLTPTPTGIQQLQAAFPNSPGVAAIANFGPAAISAGNPTFSNQQIRDVCSSTLATCPTGSGVPIEFGTITRFLPFNDNTREGMGRFDWQLSSKDRLFVRYNYQDFANNNSTGRFTAGEVVSVPGRTQQVAGDWVRNWTNTFINQARYSFSKAGFGFEEGTTGCNRASILTCVTNVNFVSGSFLDFGIQNNLPQGREINTWTVQDNATWVVNRHTFKFGGSLQHQRSPNVFLPNINGTFNFSNFNSLVANKTSSLVLADGPPSFDFTEYDVGSYFQDDWRVKDNLTLNLGVRWEWNQQAINLLHDLTVANQTGSNPFWDTTLPLDLTTVHKIPQDLNNWGPNIGFAWTPRILPSIFGQDKTVIRGGFRIAYDPEFYNMFLNVATAAPVVNLGTITGGVGLPSGGNITGNSIRSAGLLGLIPRGADPGFRSQTNVTDDFHNPYTEQWSLGVQRAITPKMALEVRYVGNHTVGNFQTIDGNPALNPIFSAAFAGTGDLASEFPSAGFPTGCTTPGTPGADEERLDCNKSLVRTRANSAFSIYHGLQTELRIQNWHGLSSGLAYTYSRAIDNVSEIFSTFGGGVTVAGSESPFNTNTKERGVAGTSYPHVASLWWVYDLPWMRSQSSLLGHILGGWEVSGAWRYRSGQTFNVAQAVEDVEFCDDNFNITFYGTTSCRPAVGNPGAPLDTVGICTDPTAANCGMVDFFSGSTTSASNVHWIYNNVAYAQFVGNAFPGSGRNILRAQTSNNLDFGLFKSTKLTEKFNLQLRLTASNVFNRQFRGTPDPFMADGRFNLNQSDPAFNPNGSFMNNFFNGSNNRRLTLGVKIVF